MIRKFPKIQGFKNVRKLAQRLSISRVDYTGTVKLHGTNASVVYTSDGIKIYQSRNRVLSESDDNAGFCVWAMNNNIMQDWGSLGDYDLIIYGEWCGGNIQKGMAISGLDKMFVIFDIVFKYHDETKPSDHVLDKIYDDIIYGQDDVLSRFNKQNVYFSNQFKIWKTTIDYTDSKSVQEFALLAEEATLSVESSCPVGEDFDRPNMLGEGIVWVPTNVSPEHYTDMIIKTKGKKHSATKVKTIVPLTEEQLEELTKYEDFVKMTVTTSRVNQALSEFSNENKDIGNVIRWVYNDIMDEENDLMEENNIEPKKVGKMVSYETRNHMMNLS